MISIIVIGQNEGWRLTRSLESVFRMISSYPQYNFEVFYIDSDSSDDSIERVKAFDGIQLFQITGTTNSAIARNIGAKESMGEILFFIDADMEIESEFLKHALDKSGNLKFNYLTGHIDDFFYTVNDEFIGFEPRTYNTKIPAGNQELSQNGGLCLISRIAWDLVGGMRNKYERGEDFDLTIRLKKNGIKIIRIPFLAAKHHTIDYRNEKRMWKMLWQGSGFFPAMIFRDHIFNKGVIKGTLRSEYTAFLLFFFCSTLIIGSPSFIICSAALYSIILFLRIFVHAKKAKSTKNKSFYFFERFVFQFLLDISFWFGFLFYFPSSPVVQQKSIF